jgi:Protein of unknown function (DUF1524)
LTPNAESFRPEISSRMRFPRISRSAATAAALLAAVLTASTATPAPAADPPAAPHHVAAAQRAAVPTDLPEPPPAETAWAELGSLTVAQPHSMEGYSRSRFPHWIIQSGACDTREVVLARDGRDVERDGQCRAISGRWVSAYDGKELTAASQVDIDHIVPLANAWRSGADTWTTPARRGFANDLTLPQLLAVSASSNRGKADQSPDRWKPQRSYWCAYSRAWIDVKAHYGLDVTAPERDSLVEMLGTCGT